MSIVGRKRSSSLAKSLEGHVIRYHVACHVQPSLFTSFSDILFKNNPEYSFLSTNESSSSFCCILSYVSSTILQHF